MNINDIPLPATPSKKINLFDVSKVIDNKDNYGSSSRVLPLKRHVNKLPVGVIQKSDDSKVNNQHRKELFLPTMNDKIQLAMSSLNPVQSKTLEMLLNATKLKPVELNNNEIKINDEKRTESKSDSRKRRLHDEPKEAKKSKIDVKINVEEKPHKHKLDNHTRQVTMKSQVIVKQNVKILENNKTKSRHDNDYDVYYNDKRNRKRDKSYLSPSYRSHHHHHNQEYSHNSYINEDNGSHRKYRSSFVVPNSHSSRVDHKNNSHNHRTADNHHHLHHHYSSHNTAASRPRKRSRSFHNIAIINTSSSSNNHNHNMRSKNYNNNHSRCKNDIDYPVTTEMPRPKRIKQETHSHFPQTNHNPFIKNKKSSSSKSKSSSSSSSSSSISSTSSSSSSSSSSSISTSSSASKMSKSSSNNDNEDDCIELPMISPKSPDEDNNSRLMDCSITDDNNKQVILTTTAMANDCLKELSATLVKMNMAYKNVYSKIPLYKADEDKKPDIVPILKPEAIILPEKQCDNVHCKSPTQIYVDNDNVNANNKEIFEVPNKPAPPSINIDNLSHISQSSIGSKNLKSPLYSLNLSSHSKDSGHSEAKLRPLIPRITSFTVNYKGIDKEFLTNELFLKNHSKFYMDEMKCSCLIPNPDDWNNGTRSCSNGQNCILAELKVECSSQYCPTESLCCNSQFTELELGSYKSHNIEFFFDIYQSIPWKIRTKKIFKKNKLIFELAGVAEFVSANSNCIKECAPTVFISQHIKINIRKDPYSFVYYLSHTNSEEQSNVRMEKWISDGQIRLGVFAAKDLQPGDELIAFFPTNNKLCLFYENAVTLDSREAILNCMQYVLHEPISYKTFVSILDNLLLNHNNDPFILEYFVNLGGPAVLCRLCDNFYKNDILCADLYEKLIDVLVLVPYRNRKDVEMLGVNIRDYVNHFCERMLPFLSLTNIYIDKLNILPELMSSIANDAPTSSSSLSSNNSTSKQNNVSSNSDILHCRLPPYWVSKECIYNNEYRVFFYHRLTKSMQWEMPVYPWEANEDNDVEIYDYNSASSIQVSHDEIQQMYVNLNKIYEMKQKKILAKVNVVKRKKDNQEMQKKDIFKKRITGVILNLLKPYRSADCKEGKIESDDDLNYLTNKLSQTILFKELKILNDKPDNLEVTAQVETKTKAYVKTYMQSRGIIYKRPAHYSLSDQKETQ